MFDVGGITIGALYTYESENRPVVAKKSYQPQNAKVVEGDIVYRYNSRTERAKYPEVKKILDEAKVKESKAMMSHIEELVKAGASNAAVLDFGKSTLRGAGGETVLVDEGLLKKISFIKEGEFSEVAGAPTLKLVGELQGARTIAIGPERIVRTALGTEDVITDFLEQTHIGNPDDYLRQAVRSTIAYLPMQFYRQLAELTDEDLKAFVEGVTTRAQAKAKILKRLETGDPMRIKTPSTTSGADSTKRRRAFYEKLSKRTVPSVSDPRQAQFLMDAVQSLGDDQIHDIFEELLPEMRRLFDEYYVSDAKFADALRRACCRVDIALYGADTDTN